MEYSRIALLTSYILLVAFHCTYQADTKIKDILDKAKVGTGSSGTAGSRTDEKVQVILKSTADRIKAVKDSLDSIKGAKTKSDVVKGVEKIMEETKKQKLTEYTKGAIAGSALKESLATGVTSQVEIITAMGPLALNLETSVIKKMDLNSAKEIIKIAQAQAQKENVLTPPTQGVLFEKLVKELKPNEWTESYAQSLTPLAQAIADHKGLRKLPKEAISGFVKMMKDRLTDCKKRELLVDLYLKQYDVKKDFLDTMLPSLGDSLCHLSIRDLKSIPQSVVPTKEQVHSICKVKWSESQVKVILPIVTRQSSFSDLNKTTCDDKMKFGNCWRGVKSQVFEMVSVDKDMIRCFNGVDLPVRLAAILSRKIKASVGSISNLDPKDLRDVLAATELTLQELKDISAEKFKNISDAVEDQIKKRKIKDRVVIQVASEQIVEEKIKENSFKLVGLARAIVSSVSLTTMRKITVEQFGFLDNEANDTDSKEDREDDHVGVSNSAVVVGKLKIKYGNPKDNESNWERLIPRMGPYLCGLSVKDVTDLPDFLFPQFVSAMRDFTAKCLPMASGIGKRFASYFAALKSEVMTMNDVALLEDNLPSLRFSLLTKLQDDDDARAIAIMAFRRACNSGRVATWRMEILTKISLAMLRITSGSTITAEHIETLGCLVPFMAASIFDQIKPDVIASSAEILGQFNFPAAIRQKLIAKLKEKEKLAGNAQSFASLTAEQLRSYLPLIGPGLTRDDIKDINASVLKEVQDQLAQVELSPEASAEAAAKVSASSGGTTARRRRATSSNDLSNKTASEIIQMGQLLKGLTADEIKTINDNVFKEVLDFIGDIVGFSQTQQQAWVAVLKRAYSGLSSLTADDLKRMNMTILGMTTTEMGQLILKDLSAISTLSAVNGYSTDQITAMFNKIKADLSRSGVDNFIDQEIIAAGKFLTASDHSKLNSLPSNTYKSTSKHLGEVEGWSVDHMKSLKSLAVAAYGQVNTWDVSVAADVGAAVGGCTSAELQAITPEAFAAVKPMAIKQIPTDLFKEITVDQIKAMSGAQFAVVTSAQINSLSQAKLAVFKEESGYEQDPNTSDLLTRDCSESKEGCDNGATTNAGYAATLLLSSATIFWAIFV